MHLINLIFFGFFRVVGYVFGAGMIGSVVAILANLPSDLRAIFRG